jgi:hypothetical protein
LSASTNLLKVANDIVEYFDLNSSTFDILTHFECQR